MQIEECSEQNNNRTSNGSYEPGALPCLCSLAERLRKTHSAAIQGAAEECNKAAGAVHLWSAMALLTLQRMDEVNVFINELVRAQLA